MEEIRLQVNQLLLFSDVGSGQTSLNEAGVIPTNGALNGGVSNGAAANGGSGTKGAAMSHIEQLAPIVRQAINADLTEELNDALQDLETAHDIEIRELCENPANPFIDVAGPLAEIQNTAQQLSKTVRLVSAQMERSSDQLVEKATRQVTMNRTRTNIESALDTTRRVLQALEHTNQVHILLRRRHYVAAVQNLQDLQSMQLDKLQHLGLGAMISSAVPALARLIKQSCLESVDVGFLAVPRLRTLITEVGAKAIKLLAKQRAQWDRTVDSFPHLKPFRFNSPVEQAYRQSSENFLVESRLEIDLSAVYEAELVFSKLDQTPELAIFVETQLEACSEELVSSGTSTAAAQTANSDRDVLDKLPDVAGFCVLDRVMSRQLPKIRPSKKVDDTWERLAQHVSAIVSASLPRNDGHEDFLRVRSQLCALMETLGNFGFNVGSIKVLLREILKHLSEKLLAQTRHAFTKYWHEGDRMQMVVGDHELFEETMAAVWLDSPPPAGPYPRAMPFSEIYPLTCRDVRAMISHLSSFLDQFQQDPGIVEDTLYVTLDTFLKDTVCHTMARALRTDNREQILQIFIDLQQFQIASRNVEQLLEKMRSTTGGRSRGRVTLESSAAFAETAKRAEARIFELVEANVASFFEDASYDWRATEPPVGQSQYALDMTAYLLSLTNSMLVRLPSDIRSLVYLSAADQISVGLSGVLRNADDGITPEGLQAFRTDFEFLEEFLSELADASNTPSLSLNHSEVSQMIDLLQSDDPTEYNNPRVRMRKYDRLAPESIPPLLQKLSRPSPASPHPSTPVTSPRTPQTGFMRYLSGDKT